MRLIKVAVAATAAGLLWMASVMPALASLPSSRVTPDPSSPGTPTTFGVFCGASAKSATLAGSTLGLPDKVPMNPTSSTQAGEFVVTVVLPAGIAPGTYHPAIDCSNGTSGTVAVRVSPVPAKAPQTGGGSTSTVTGSPLEWAGLGVAGLGVLIGALSLRRRRASSRT
jgi:hypothetical protein